ncbi:hypothetical protein BVRB_019200, partial [Beta vulgaris subsp. vulgaris]
MLLYRRFPLQQPSSIYKQFNRFKSLPSIKIVQSDKNSGLVALHILDYHHMVMSHLSNCDIYSHIGSNQCQRWFDILSRIRLEHTVLLKAIAHHVRDLPKNTIKFLRDSKTVLPIFHCLPKLHKPNRPGRPIIGSPAWITTRWSILLDCLLEKAAVPFALKNSSALITSLEGYHLSSSYILCSADVASLYTNMTLSKLYDIIERCSDRPYLVTILKFICNNNYFMYGNNVFQQLDGIAMG